MNELTAKLLESAWKDLPAQHRTLDWLKCEVATDWVIWRNWEIETGLPIRSSMFSAGQPVITTGTPS